MVCCILDWWIDLVESRDASDGCCWNTGFMVMLNIPCLAESITDVMKYLVYLRV